MDRDTELEDFAQRNSVLKKDRRLFRELAVLEGFVVKKLDIKRTSIDSSFILQALLHSYAYDKKYSAWRTHRDLVKEVLNSLENAASTEQGWLQALTNKMAAYTRSTGKSIEQQGTLALIIKYAQHKITLEDRQGDSTLIEEPADIKKRWEDTLGKLKIIPEAMTAFSAADEAKQLLNAYAHPKMFTTHRHYKTEIANLLHKFPNVTAAQYYYGLLSILEFHPGANPQGTLAMMVRTLKDLSKLEAQGKTMRGHIINMANEPLADCAI